MKVLVAAVPEAGHVNPLLPLVRALVDRGDQVVFAAATDPVGAIAASGAECRPTVTGAQQWFETLGSRTRGMPGDGLAPERILYYFAPRLFGEVAADDQIDDLLSVGRELKPDFVLSETYAFAAPLAAAVLGVPFVHHLISPMMTLEMMELVNDAVSPLWRSFGLDSPGYGGVYSGVTIEVCPPSLEPLDVPGGRKMAIRPAPLPVMASTPSQPPLVYVTLGTIMSNPEIFRTVLDALADEDLQVVATVGADKDPAEVGPVPANARVERYIPQAELLPGCSAVVHHGGSGTMFGTLAHGIPHVVVPQGADNYLNGDLLARAGVADTLRPADVTVDQVRKAVRRVLDEPSYTESARRLAGEVAALPDAADTAAQLHAMFG